MSIKNARLRVLHVCAIFSHAMNWPASTMNIIIIFQATFFWPQCFIISINFEESQSFNTAFKSRYMVICCVHLCVVVLWCTCFLSIMVLLQPVLIFICALFIPIAASQKRRCVSSIRKAESGEFWKLLRSSFHALYCPGASRHQRECV